MLDDAFFYSGFAVLSARVKGTAGGEYRAPPSRQSLRFQRMSPEQRVNIALELSSSITSITMESIKNQNPHISTARLLEKARKRFQAGRRTH